MNEQTEPAKSTREQKYAADDLRLKADELALRREDMKARLEADAAARKGSLSPLCVKIRTSRDREGAN